MKFSYSLSILFALIIITQVILSMFGLHLLGLIQDIDEGLWILYLLFVVSSLVLVATIVEFIRLEKKLVWHYIYVVFVIFVFCGVSAWSYLASLLSGPLVGSM